MCVCVMVGAIPSREPDKGFSKDSGRWRGFATGGLRENMSVVSAMPDVRRFEEKLLRGATTE